jgi:hypothetical protein
MVYSEDGEFTSQFRVFLQAWGTNREILWRLVSEDFEKDVNLEVRS